MAGRSACLPLLLLLVITLSVVPTESRMHLPWGRNDSDKPAAASPQVCE
jgi:hypothetical protein